MPSKAWPQATRARAVALYRDHTAREVSEELGVPEGSIRVWAKQARDRDGGDSLPATAGPGERADWVSKKEAAAQESFAIAQEALAEVRKLIAAGKYNEAQRTALTFAITTDKSAVLEDAAESVAERTVRVTERVAEQLATAVERVFADLGLPIDAVRGIVAHHLRHVEDAEPPRAPDADRVATAVATRLAERWEASLPREEIIEAEVVQEPEPADEPEPEAAEPEPAEPDDLDYRNQPILPPDDRPEPDGDGIPPSW